MKSKLKFQGNLVKGDFGTALPLIIFGGLSVIAGVLSLFLPETKGKILPETIEDAEQFGKYVFTGVYIKHGYINGKCMSHAMAKSFFEISLM